MARYMSPRILEFPKQDYEINCLGTVVDALYTDRQGIFLALIIDAMLDLIDEMPPTEHGDLIINHMIEIGALLRELYHYEY